MPTPITEPDEVISLLAQAIEEALHPADADDIAATVVASFERMSGRKVAEYAWEGTTLNMRIEPLEYIEVIFTVARIKNLMAHDPPESCTAPIGDGKTPPFWCGRPAVGPHPDPELGYRFPLCALHRAEEEETVYY